MFLINNASKFRDSAMYPHPLTDDTSYPHCNKLRNKLVSQINTEKLTDYLCLYTCKTIQSPIRHHNKIDHLRASVYCFKAKLWTCFETGRCVLTEELMHVSHF